MADGTSVASAGLVPSKTTLTRSGVVGVVSKENSHRARIKRMRRTVLNSSRMLIRQRRGFRDKWKLVTLTYEPGQEWKPSQVRDFLQRVRMWMKRRRWPFAYVWVLELTQAGVPHYHVLVRIPYRGTLPYADEMGWWPHGSTNTEPARSPVGYIAKYASKGVTADDLPKGARLCGAAGLVADSRVFVQFWNLPVWARERLTEVQRTKRLPGGFVATGTGEFLLTPYAVIYRGGVLLIVLKETQP